jgi:hypothetical protein
MGIFYLYCDLSYDGTANVKGAPHIPRTYVFAGFFADDTTWGIVEDKWVAVNMEYGVPRFHAAHLYAKSNEYEGWDNARKVAYSSELLSIMKAEGKRLNAVSCGIFADEYRKIISEDGQRKMGSPYLVCFNSCITLIAKMMDAPNAFPPQDTFSVVIDSDDGYLEAIESYRKMEQNSKFPCRRRLGMCSPSNTEKIVPLQAADMAAYEVFRRLHSARDGGTSIRHPLKVMMEDNVVDERYYSADTLMSLKAEIEATPATTGYGELVIIPRS